MSRALICGSLAFDNIMVFEDEKSYHHREARLSGHRTWFSRESFIPPRFKKNLEEKYLGMEIIWEKTFRYGNLDEKCRFRNSEENQRELYFWANKNSQKIACGALKRRKTTTSILIFGQKIAPEGGEIFWMKNIYSIEKSEKITLVKTYQNRSEMNPEHYFSSPNS